MAAAEEVFAAKGYRATTIDDLLAVTGLSRGHYFAAKEDVLHMRSRRGAFPRTLAVVLRNETPAAAFRRDLIQRLAAPFADILAEFPVAEPSCTAELILDLLMAVTRSPHRAAYLADAGAQARLTLPQLTRRIAGRVACHQRGRSWCRSVGGRRPRILGGAWPPIIAAVRRSVVGWRAQRERRAAVCRTLASCSVGS